MRFRTQIWELQFFPFFLALSIICKRQVGSLYDIESFGMMYDATAKYAR